MSSGPAHAGMCNRGQLSTAPCARRYKHTLHTHTKKQPAPEQTVPAQRHTELCHTVPHAAALFLSGADGGRARGRKQLWSWMADPTRLSAAEPSSGNKNSCVCVFGSITKSVNANCVCHCGLMVGIFSPIEAPWTQKTEDKPIKQPISMMAATLI